MVRIEGEIVINRPVDEVFDFVADERMSRDTVWGNLKSLLEREATTPGQS
jgi:hypothetical protein